MLKVLCFLKNTGEKSVIFGKDKKEED